MALITTIYGARDGEDLDDKMWKTVILLDTSTIQGIWFRDTITPVEKIKKRVHCSYAQVVKW